jgi:hypothetical protein
MANTDDNVASATKLATTRSIWGQLFDGTADITGDFTTANNAYVAGNVGIGTTSPAYKLDVSGDGNFTGNVTSKGTMKIQGWGSFYAYGHSNGFGGFNIMQGLANGEAMRIEPYSNTGTWLKNCITMSTSGNVRIGAAGTNGYKLDVVGTGRFTDTVTLLSTLTISGQAALNGGAVIPADKTLKIGDCEITWDSDNECLTFSKTIASNGDVVAYK